MRHDLAANGNAKSGVLEGEQAANPLSQIPNYQHRRPRVLTDKQIPVGPLFQKSTLDVLVISTLGVDLESLTSPETPFFDLYEIILHQSVTGNLISFIDGHIPIRDWLPLPESRRWLNAIAEVRRLFIDRVRLRMAEMNASEKSNRPHGEARDLLTFVIEEQPLSDHQSDWSDHELLDYVSCQQC